MFLQLVILISFLAGSVLNQEYLNQLSGGSWQVVVPKKGGGADGKSLGMQTVHATLLPSGRILLASGSSWRNRGPVETYPNMTDPQDGQGVFRLKEDPFLMNKMEDYYQLVNNVGIYDASENTFYRIPHPKPVPDPKWSEHFAPNDLFCTGHLHIPDGNVLFVGGTQYYHPFRTGHRATYLFDWRKESRIQWQSVDWRFMSSDMSVNDSTNPWIFAGMSLLTYI